MKISKNIWLLPLLFITVHIFYIGCCKCITDLKGKPYRQITTAKVTQYGFSSVYSRDTVYVKDSIFSNINISYEYITRNVSNPFQPFVGNAMAFSCNCINVKDSGYKYRLDSIGVYSNHTFATQPAGSNLISLFSGTYYNPQYGNTQADLPVPVLLDTLNFYKDYYSVSLKLKLADPGIKDHQFKYVLYTQGRAIEAANSKLLIWE